MQQLKALSAEQKFHVAKEGVESEIATAELRALIDDRVIRAALIKIEGMNIDGESANTENLLERGPEDLAYEIAQAIADENFLNEDERKN